MRRRLFSINLRRNISCISNRTSRSTKNFTKIKQILFTSITDLIVFLRKLGGKRKEK